MDGFVGGSIEQAHAPAETAIVIPPQAFNNHARVELLAWTMCSPTRRAINTVR